MENIKDKIHKIIAKYLPDDAKFLVSYSPDTGFGDASVACFPLAKLFKKSPDAIALDLGNRLAEDKDINQIIYKFSKTKYKFFTNS